MPGERPQKPQPTEIQAARVEHAREALDAARANRDMDAMTLGGHLGAVGWHLSELLYLVGELTAAAPALVDADGMLTITSGVTIAPDQFAVVLSALEDAEKLRMREAAEFSTTARSSRPAVRRPRRRPRRRPGLQRPRRPAARRGPAGCSSRDRPLGRGSL